MESKAEAFMWFLREKQDEAGNAVLGLTSLIHFSRFRGIGTLWYLVQMIKAEEYCLLECMSQIEELVPSMDSALVSLHVKGSPLGKSFMF